MSATDLAHNDDNWLLLFWNLSEAGKPIYLLISVAGYLFELEIAKQMIEHVLIVKQFSTNVIKELEEFHLAWFN